MSMCILNKSIGFWLVFSRVDFMHFVWCKYSQATAGKQQAGSLLKSFVSLIEGKNKETKRRCLLLSYIPLVHLDI